MYLCEFKLYLSKCVPICRLCIDRKLWMYEENRWYGFKSPGVWWNLINLLLIIFLCHEDLQQQKSVYNFYEKEKNYTERERETWLCPFWKLGAKNWITNFTYMNTDKVNVKFCPLGNFIKIYVIEATRLAPWELFTTSYLLLSQSLEVMKNFRYCL